MMEGYYCLEAELFETMLIWLASCGATSYLCLPFELLFPESFYTNGDSTACSRVLYSSSLSELVWSAHGSIAPGDSGSINFSIFLILDELFFSTRFFLPDLDEHDASMFSLF